MAVYTHLGAEQLAELIAAYEVGDLLSAKGIAEGISNSNWLVETTGGRFILTMYERRIDVGELPFFLGLLDHLAERECAVPATIHDRGGNAFRSVEGKAVALIEFLPGVSPTRPTTSQARAVGRALAQVHLAGRDFGVDRSNPLTPANSTATLARFSAEQLSSIDPDLTGIRAQADEIVANWPENLPTSIIHSDLFPDNVLMLGDEVSGMIDFYFACTDAMAYDLAVTHAAWCFDKSGTHFDSDIGSALLEGYASVRAITEAEHSQLPLLAQGACLRFAASRTEDWLETPSGALVERKDPMEFVRRWRFYAENGPQVFA